jgi:hypothetical protein
LKFQMSSDCKKKKATTNSHKQTAQRNFADPQHTCSYQ